MSSIGRENTYIDIDIDLNLMNDLNSRINNLESNVGLPSIPNLREATFLNAKVENIEKADTIVPHYDKSYQYYVLLDDKHEVPSDSQNKNISVNNFYNSNLNEIVEKILIDVEVLKIQNKLTGTMITQAGFGKGDTRIQSGPTTRITFNTRDLASVGINTANIPIFDGTLTADNVEEKLTAFIEWIEHNDNLGLKQLLHRMGLNTNDLDSFLEEMLKAQDPLVFFESILLSRVYIGTEGDLYINANPLPIADDVLPLWLNLNEVIPLMQVELGTLAIEEALIIGETTWGQFRDSLFGAGTVGIGALVVALATLVDQIKRKADRIWDEGNLLTGTSGNIYQMSSGSVAIGITKPTLPPLLSGGNDLPNKLEVNGNINIHEGFQYKINNVPLAYTDLGSPLLQGTNIEIVDNTINNTYILPTATDSVLGGVKVDNSTITIVDGVISGANTYSLPTATDSVLGGVRVDGTTITINGSGVISGANRLTAGTNIQIVGNAINNTYSLPTAGVGAGGTLGGVRVDNSTITINGSGVISGANTYTLPTAGIAAGGTLGGVRVDNSTITINGSGVITSTGGLPATIRLTPTATDGFYSWINSQALLAKTPATGVLYSSGSADGDIVLRSDTDRALILQSGIGDPSITLNAGTNMVRIHQRVGINTQPNTNYWLDVNGSINATELRVGGNLIPISQWITTDTQISYTGGRVGIGITNPPFSLLHLHKTATLQDVRLQFTDGTSTSVSNCGLAIGKGTDNRSFIFNYENTGLFFGTNATERMTISNTGNVGIGTSTAINNKLEVNGTINATELRVNGVVQWITTNNTICYNNGRVGIGKASVPYTLAVLDVNGDVRVKGDIDVWSQTLPFMRLVKFSGNEDVLDLNTNSWGVILRQVLMYISSVNDYIFYIDVNSNSTPPTNPMSIGFRIFSVDKLLISNNIISSTIPISSTSYILSNGRVYSRGSAFDTWLSSEGGMSLNMGLISTETAPTYFKMGAYLGHTYYENNLNRNHRFYIYSGTLSGTPRLWEFHTNSGSYNALNSANWTATSDQRIKENIVRADLKTCYDNVKNINLYRFNYIDSFQTSKQDKNKLGYIAQEVKRHFPKATYRKKERLIDKREIPDLLSIDVEQINLTLYGAVKQLIKLVEKQNKRIKTLETLLNIEDDDNIENDAGETYERIYDDEEVNIDDIEPTEPEQDKAPEPPQDKGPEPSVGTE